MRKEPHPSKIGTDGRRLPPDAARLRCPRIFSTHNQSFIGYSDIGSLRKLIMKVVGMAAARPLRRECRCLERSRPSERFICSVHERATRHESARTSEGGGAC